MTPTLYPLPIYGFNMARRQQVAYRRRHRKRYHRIPIGYTRRPNQFRRWRGTNYRGRQNRSINGHVRSFKRSCLRQGRKLRRTNMQLTGRQKNVQFVRYNRTSTLTIEAYAGQQQTDGAKGRYFISLQLGNFMTPDNIDYIKTSYQCFNILSLTIRGQIVEIYRPFYRGIAVQGDPSTQNIANTMIGDSNMTPRIYALLSYNADSLVPTGASGTIGSDALDDSYLASEGEWKDHPRSKQFHNRKPFQIYYNTPTYVRSKKRATSVLNIQGTDSISSLILADSNQTPNNMNFYWADLPRYAYSASTNQTKIRMNIQFHILLKLTDSTKWSNI